MAGPGPWRVFLSHTSELRQYPERGDSYIHHAERAVSAAGHVIVDMEDFEATDRPPVEIDDSKIRSSDVYVGIYGLRYGTPVRNRPDKSYTELEFDTATALGLPRLLFLLDSQSRDHRLPPEALVDRQNGHRQDAFLERVQNSGAGITIKFFRNPDDLARLLERSLRVLAEERQHEALFTTLQPQLNTNQPVSEAAERTGTGEAADQQQQPAVQGSVMIPRVFLSYSHDSEAHKVWVRQLAERLVASGVEVTLDQWDLKPGMDVVLFGETAIRKADRVLMVCSPTYVRKAEQPRSGTGQECLIVSAHMARQADTRKFIPLLRQPGPEAHQGRFIPDFLGARLWVDFRDDAGFEQSLKELLHELFEVPRYPKPVLGGHPFIPELSTSKLIPETRISNPAPLSPVNTAAAQSTQRQVEHERQRLEREAAEQQSWLEQRQRRQQHWEEEERRRQERWQTFAAALRRPWEVASGSRINRCRVLIGAAGLPLVVAGAATIRSLQQPRPPGPFPFTTRTARLQRQGDAWQVERSPVRVAMYREPLAAGLELRLLQIPAGRFMMGSPPEEVDRYDAEGPQHEVTLREFLISQTPITQAQWRVVAGWSRVARDLNPDPASFKGADRPVEGVSWYDAMEFCQRLSRRTGRFYTLPSEAQWEYACRAGTTTPFHFGATLTPELANYDGNFSYANGPMGAYRQETTPVGQFPANAWGLQDMHGNVWEWCLDHWHGSYQGAPGDGSAWLDPVTSEEGDKKITRLLRGGSWFNVPHSCRAAGRDGFSPVDDDSSVGLRPCCCPSPPGSLLGS